MSSAVAEIADLADLLLALIERETDLVRAGRLREAAPLAAQKAELSGRYLAASRASRSDLSSKGSQALRDKLTKLQTALALNAMVLATAHAVAEGLIRTAAIETARNASPQVYGAAGKMTAPYKSALRPVAVSTAL